ncbi:hypothetical protein [Streptomyces marispadix]|uniref:DUF1700 domain-containing protein n=1 Tax=Streptomyces marispadix TaxID=2922868 RepID=A0ABS9T3A2_9ACTN|nr:hypothetical protein [Streptomyces marispadix]MCH6163001.1 hypothetical protein [Streptomyces marispadix]
MTSLLEKRYRRVLRMLPASYRAQREEEIVDTYLQDFDEYEQDELRPTWREVASIAALAVRTRTGGAGAAPRHVLAGATVRLFALLSILLHGARELTDRALALAYVSGAPARDRDLFLGVFDGQQGVLSGVRETLLWLLPLCWVAAYAALLRDRRRTALVLSVLAALPALMFAVDWATGGPVRIDGFDIAFAASGWLTVLALSCAFHSDAPAARLPAVRPGLALMAVCVLMGGSVVLWRDGADSVWSSGTVCVLAGVLWWAAALVRGDRRGRSGEAPAGEASAGGAGDPAVPLALALLSLVVLAERTGMLALLVQSRMPASYLYAAGAQAAVLAGLVVALGVAGGRLARRGQAPLPTREESGALE